MSFLLAWTSRCTRNNQSIASQWHWPRVQKPMKECAQFPIVLASLMELIVRKLMSEDGTKPTQTITLIHVGDVPMRNGVHLSRLGSKLSTALNHNYPGRLNKMYVLDLPTSALWFFKLMLRFVPPSTRRKIQLCASTAPEVPREITALPSLRPSRPAEAHQPAVPQPPVRRSLWALRAPRAPRAPQAAAAPAAASVKSAASESGATPALLAALQPWAGGDTGRMASTGSDQGLQRCERKLLFQPLFAAHARGRKSTRRSFLVCVLFRTIVCSYAQ